MTLRDRMNESLKQAMKARDARRVSTLRMVFAAIKDREIRSDVGPDIADEDLVTLLAKMIKQRDESALTYDSAGRPELAAAEREEIAIIREFMPKQLSDEEIRGAVQAIISETGATGPKDMGKVMAALKQRHAGSMDFGKGSAAAKELLATTKA